MAFSVAAPQWRVDHDREQAALTALAAGADQLHLDFGGPRRGARLDTPGQLAAARDIARTIATPALAVDYVTEIGLADAESTAILDAALDCALELGVRVLHVPDSSESAHGFPERRAKARTALSRICERAEDRLVVAYESKLGAADSVALIREVGHAALRAVLDTGNLIEAGHDPTEFAATTQLAGVLHTDIHVKAPRSARTDGFAVLPALASRGAVGSVLVKNDYRENTRLLSSDIMRCRRLGPRQSKTVRLPY